MELRDVSGPDRLHAADVLVRHLSAMGERHAVVGHLRRVPAVAGTEDEAAARQQVEGGDLLGKHDRVVQSDQADTCP